MEEGYFAVRFRCDAVPVRWPSSFAIVSAYATTGESWPAERNRDADERLQSQLRALAAWHLRIVGYHPGTGHAEPSWAVDVSVETARCLGAQFLQDAIFWVQDGELNVVKCRAPWGLVPLGTFDRRLDTPPGGESQAV